MILIDLAHLLELDLFLKEDFQVSCDNEVHVVALGVLRDNFILWDEHLVFETFYDKIDCEGFGVTEVLVLVDDPV
jgi:hypothetical protein